jgi:excisionase family DNA binding protein
VTVLTEAEAAKYLKIGRTKLRSLVDRGLIEYVRIDQGGRNEMRRFTTDLLDAFVERSVVSAETKAATRRTSRANPYY